MKDVEGNVYQTVKIGNQEWTVENLRTTKFNDGSPIPLVTGDSEWESAWIKDNKYTNLPAYCYYENSTDPEHIKKYGALYNWHVVNTGKLAPTGWHVPTDAEWTELEEYLIANGYNWDGTKEGNKIAKSLASKTEWKTHDNTGSIGNNAKKNNASGFSALPGGYRYDWGSFDLIGFTGYWWSATEHDTNNAWCRYLYCNSGSLSRNSRHDDKGGGLSVRLLRD